MRNYLKLPPLFLTCVFVLWGFAAPAVADTDYRCLNICVSGGKPESVCMPQCSYSRTSQNQTPGEASKQPSAPLPKHRILPTLLPVDNRSVILNDKPASPYNESKDYHCIALCLQERMQYDTCQSSCTTVRMKNGEPLSSAAATAAPLPGLAPPQSK